MSREYPRISKSEMLKRSPMCPCGEAAQWRLTVQVSWFRGDDEFAFRCDKHRRDIDEPQKANPCICRGHKELDEVWVCPVHGTQARRV